MRCTVKYTLGCAEKSGRILVNQIHVFKENVKGKRISWGFVFFNENSHFV